jgi:hypothetical protein
MLAENFIGHNITLGLDFCPPSLFDNARPLNLRWKRFLRKASRSRDAPLHCDDSYLLNAPGLAFGGTVLIDRQ